tara:strand:+ start:4961 stop:6364 length:1404 start_codon:yes stop_codon:yes gene_type:complete
MHSPGSIAGWRNKQFYKSHNMKNNNDIGRRNFIKKTGLAAAAPLLMPLPSAAWERVPFANAKKRIALVGTGTRGSNAWARPIVERYRDHVELVALCDSNNKRMAFAQNYIGTQAPIYNASDFDKMIKVTRPDTVIVTTTDCFHEKYIIRAMELGCDVISEKPLVTDALQAQRIIDAEKRTGKSITTTFNARFGNESEEIKRILDSGELGRVISAEYHEFLDIHHGASYFRRWHGKKKFSGSLLVHKASHHFDQMNWWLGSDPKLVSAFGKVGYYGKNNAFRGTNCRTCSFKDSCDFYWDINTTRDKGLYLEGESEDGYLRDGCVWDEAIDTYDSMTVEVKYANDVLLSYSLNAFMPYEGQRIAFNCEKGRLDVRTYQNQPWEVADSFEFRITKNFGESQAYGLSSADGDHGGADDKLRNKLFLTDPAEGGSQIAGSRSGLLASLVGIAAVQSIETGTQQSIDALVSF